MNVKLLKRSAVLALVAGILAGCGQTPQTAPGGLTPEEARGIAKDAYIYGFPLVTNYETMYKQAIDTTNHDYQGPFNSVTSSKNVATPDDKFVVTPNSDTPYSYLWMDLRAEPLVVTVPKIDKGRYYTGQMVDLYTFNFAYVGTRSFGNDGGKYLVAGPGWKGETPKGVSKVFRCETEFAYIIFRTQLFNPADIKAVNKIQAGYHAEPLSKYLKQAAPAAAPAVNWQKPTGDITKPPTMFKYLNFLLQFCPPSPSETDLLARFAKLSIGAGKTFDDAKFSPEIQKAIADSVSDAATEIADAQKQINTDQLSSSQLFGTREFLKGNYLYRFMGAKLGLYGNSGEDAIYYGYFVDGHSYPLDAAKSNYELHFDKGHLPPAKAFWSLTMYDGKTQLLVANPLKRYLLNSTTLKSYKYGADGSLTLYVQKNSPGAVKEPNWLPAPDGPFYCVLRLYMPAPEVLSGDWKKPQMQAAATE